MIKELQDLELSMSEQYTGLRKLFHTLEEAYEAACKKDPGLADAWMKARESNPDIGWLDIAADREKRGLTG